MSTLQNFVGVFDQRVYMELNKTAANYMREDAQINWIPVQVLEKKNAYEYKKPLLDESIGVKGVHDIGKATRQMETPRKVKTYNLEGVEADIYYDFNDITLQGEFLAQQKSEEVKRWADVVKQSYFKGVFTEGFNASGAGVGQRLNQGIIEQATLVSNLNGANSALTSAGDVYKALDRMVGAIPYRIRDGRRVMIGCDDLFRRKARTVLFRGANNQKSEFDIFFEELKDSNPQGTEGLITTPLVVSDKLFLNLVPGATKLQTDVAGTHSRLFAAVVDPSIIEAAYSFYGLMGEGAEPTIRGVAQKWFARLAGCVHQPEAVCYSDQITWSN